MTHLTHSQILPNSPIYCQLISGILNWFVSVVWFFISHWFADSPTYVVFQLVTVSAGLSVLISYAVVHCCSVSFRWWVSVGLSWVIYAGHLSSFKQLWPACNPTHSQPLNLFLSCLPMQIKLYKPWVNCFMLNI